MARNKSEAEIMARGLDNVCTGIVWLLLAVIGFFATLPSGMSNAWWIAAIAFLAGCYAISGSGPFARPAIRRRKAPRDGAPDERATAHKELDGAAAECLVADDLVATGAADGSAAPTGVANADRRTAP